MDERTPCPYCENFQGSGFIAQGKVQIFNFCPVCGRPYTPEGTKLLHRRQKSEPHGAGDRFV